MFNVGNCETSSSCVGHGWSWAFYLNSSSNAKNVEEITHDVPLANAARQNQGQSSNVLWRLNAWNYKNILLLLQVSYRSRFDARN